MKLHLERTAVLTAAMPIRPQEMSLQRPPQLEIVAVEDRAPAART